MPTLQVWPVAESHPSWFSRDGYNCGPTAEYTLQEGFFFFKRKKERFTLSVVIPKPVSIANQGFS
jgi:hypothetical protein